MSLEESGRSAAQPAWRGIAHADLGKTDRHAANPRGPNLEHLSDYNINADAGVRASLTKTMFTEFKVEWKHDRTPAPDNSKDDLRYLLGLGWAF